MHLTYPKYNALKSELLEIFKGLNLRDTICVALGNRIPSSTTVLIDCIQWINANAKGLSLTEATLRWKKQSKVYQFANAFEQMAILALFRGVWEDYKNEWVILLPYIGDGYLAERLGEVTDERLANDKLKKANANAVS